MRLFDSLSEDDRAVSPVIGVVLMIAVVVILAAVVGAFATGVFGGQTDAPQAAFSYDGESLTMESGENIPSDQLDVQTSDDNGAGSWENDPVTAGTNYEFTTAPGDGETVTVIWTSSDGGNSAVLFESDN